MFSSLTPEVSSYCSPDTWTIHWRLPDRSVDLLPADTSVVCREGLLSDVASARRGSHHRVECHCPYPRPQERPAGVGKIGGKGYVCRITQPSPQPSLAARVLKIRTLGSSIMVIPWIKM